MFAVSVFLCLSVCFFACVYLQMKNQHVQIDITVATPLKAGKFSYILLITAVLNECLSKSNVMYIYIYYWGKRNVITRVNLQCKVGD